MIVPKRMYIISTHDNHDVNYLVLRREITSMKKIMGIEVYRFLKKMGIN